MFCDEIDPFWWFIGLILVFFGMGAYGVIAQAPDALDYQVECYSGDREIFRGTYTGGVVGRRLQGAEATAVVDGNCVFTVVGE